MDFWTELAEIAARRDVLRHPFYERWSVGELSRRELALYTGQYRHAVVALADASAQAAELADPAARGELQEHAAEEAAHIELWDDFTAAVGGDVAASPTPESADCASAWAGAAPLLPLLVRLYAIESAQPQVAATKHRGLAEHYGITGAGAAYFTLHEERDVEHATAARTLIAERLDGANKAELLEEADRVLAANWRLLDGAERLAA